MKSAKKLERKSDGKNWTETKMAQHKKRMLQRKKALKRHER